jgi:general secretion pathway protein A
MYEDLFHFFGLREDPFHVSPDPRYYFATRGHNSALKELTAGIESRRGLFVLTGEAGTGKTTLVRHFLDWLETRHQSSCYIFHSQLRPMELLELILQDFGITCASRDKHDIVVALNKWLVERRRMGDAPVLVIDEAQTSPLRTLRRLNVLLNLELDGCKLLQVLLAGQPELDEKLQRPELWQLQQRIIFRSRLMPLAMEETAEYVRARLEKAGAAEEVFCEKALQAIHTGARGIPRVVNLLCEHALITAYSERIKPITANIVREVATDFDLSVQTGMPTEEEMKLRAEWAAPVRMEEVSAADRPSDPIVAKETIKEAIPPIPLLPALSKWPIHVQNTERQEGTASAINEEEMAPIAVVESAAPSARPAANTTKLADVALAAGDAAVLSAPAEGNANVQVGAVAVSATTVARMPSAVPAAAARALDIPSAAEGASAPLAMAAAATTLSTAPALAPQRAKEAVEAVPTAVKATAWVEKTAKPAAVSGATKPAIARAVPEDVVAKPRAAKPTLVKPIQKVSPKVVKISVPIRWKVPDFVRNCVGYCRGVGKSFVADWKHFMQAPIQPRKQTGAGTGNS